MVDFTVVFAGELEEAPEAEVEAEVEVFGGKVEAANTAFPLATGTDPYPAPPFCLL